MATEYTTVSVFDTKTQKPIDVLYVKNADGSYSPVQQLASMAFITPDADMTQLITVVTAGTPVQGPDKVSEGIWLVKADPANTGTVYFMFHGQTKATKGFPLSAGEDEYVLVSNLNSLDFDASVNGMKIWALKIR